MNIAQFHANSSGQCQKGAAVPGAQLRHRSAEWGRPEQIDQWRPIDHLLSGCGPIRVQQTSTMAAGTTEWPADERSGRVGHKWPISAIKLMHCLAANGRICLLSEARSLRLPRGRMARVAVVVRLMF